jgi:hypothetical protein
MENNSINTRFKKGHSDLVSPEARRRASIKTALKLKGKKLSKEHIEKLIKSHIGYKMPKNQKDKISKFNKGKHSGIKSNFWKGGITPINIKIRASLEVRYWRKAVLERDNFTCQKYGINGGEIVAHHINNFADFPELRSAIDNGITLSKKAHIEFHKKYGIKNNTRSQLEEFLDKHKKIVVENKPNLC